MPLSENQRTNISSAWAESTNTMADVAHVGVCGQNYKIEVQSIYIFEDIYFESHYPLSFIEKTRRIKEKIKKMPKNERDALIEKAFGMWKDYPDSWFNFASQYSPLIYNMTTQIDINYVVSS